MIRAYLVVLVILISGLNFNSSAQIMGGDPEFDKLFDMYAMEKFEDCAFKAENMSQNEKYSKAPEPYLYMAMCFYKISRRLDEPEIAEKYKKPFEDALKYAYKFRKKDKKNELYPQNLAFFDTLKFWGIQHAEMLYLEDNYRKAGGMYKKVLKIDDSDNTIKFANGFCDVRAQNSQGVAMIQAGMKGLHEEFMQPERKPNPVTDRILVDLLVEYAKYMESVGNVDSSKATITIARDFFNEDKKVKDHYNKLHGIESEEEEVPTDGVVKVYKKSVSSEEDLSKKDDDSVIEEKTEEEDDDDEIEEEEEEEEDDPEK